MDRQGLLRRGEVGAVQTPPLLSEPGPAKNSKLCLAQPAMGEIERQEKAASPTPLVSVVIPTYQRRALVCQAVGSVLQQTFQNFELIVVDDGSTDGSEAALAGLDARIRYFWQANRGVSAARNAGIKLARGEIVALLDSDDCWLPDHLAIVSEVLRRRPEAILCTTTPRFEIGGHQPPGDAEVVDALPSLLAENIVGCPTSVAVRREPLLAAGGFDERLLVMEGWELWLRLALLGRFALLQRQTVICQATRGSLTERSAANGEYLRALGTFATSVAALATRASRRDDHALIRARAAGLNAYLQALGALARDDQDFAKTMLATACAGLPELSREPQLVANRLSLLRSGPAGRFHSFSVAASLWPDPAVDTALYLRFHALVLALRLGRGADAARMLRGWPLGATPRFLARNISVFGRLVRRWIQKQRHRGIDSAPDAPPQSP